MVHLNTPPLVVKYGTPYNSFVRFLLPFVLILLLPVMFHLSPAIPATTTIYFDQNHRNDLYNKPNKTLEPARKDTYCLFILPCKFALLPLPPAFSHLWSHSLLLNL